LNAADRQWFLDRGPSDLVSKITAPTLFEQGTVDTLFTLDEAVTNFNLLRAEGVPTAMLWMCSGHGVCFTEPGDQKRPGEAAIAWFDRYVKGDTKVEVGPLFEYVDQNGVTFTADEYPPAASTPITSSGAGELELSAGGGAGPATATGKLGGLGSLVLPFTPARADNAVNVAIEINTAANLVGAPEIALTYNGTSPSGPRPTRVFAQLVDEATGLVLGNQITPIAVILDGASHTTTVPLEMVAFTAKPPTLLTLQLVATTPAYAEPRLGGTVTFENVNITVPTVTGVTAK
jgi:ABC-2 type transport system ATP-binding protein